MNQNVPVSREMEDNYSVPNRHKNQAPGEERITELVWQNGPVEMQSQNKKPTKNVGTEVVIPAENETRFGGEEQKNLFMQEDEVASWLQIPLHYPSFDPDLYADLLNTALPPPTPVITEAPPRVTDEIRNPPPLPPLPPTVSKPESGPRMQNFGHFSRIPSRSMHQPPPATMARESTVVESNETPIVRPTEQARVLRSVAESSVQLNVESGAGTTRELSVSTFDLTVTSSPSGSVASGDPQLRPAVVVTEDRKRKAIVEHDDGGCQSEDIEFEAAEAKKQARTSTSTKRSRAAEVHSLSERRRRDKINEKMRILQELIPRCNKSDKASVLDETIECLKSLKMQVQMLNMMMYSGMQNYMPPMVMDMAMHHPMIPYPSMQPGLSMPGPANMDPRFPMPPPFPMPQVPLLGPSQAQPSNQTNRATNFPHYLNPTQMPNYVDLYQQLIMSMQQAQLPQNQGDKPSTRKEPGHPDNQHCG